MTSQAPHAHRTVFALVAGLPEQNIQIISPDIGGGFGNKVPVYPGYVVATAASLLLGRPVKWIEDRTGNLISTGFARDFYMDGELALKDDGTMTGLRVKMLSDQGYAYADAQPSKFKAGLFHIVTGSYDIPAAHVVTDGAYTNKAPGGVAYRCSFRVTEASYLIERLVQTAAYELGHRPRRAAAEELHPAGQFPYTSATGFEYDSGNYEPALDQALERVGYDEAARGAEAGARGGQADRHRPRVVHRGRRRRPEPALRHPRDQDVRLRRAARAPDGQGDPQARRQVAGPGPRDDVRADRRGGARHPARGHHRAGGRHRQHAVRPRHVRVALDAGRRRGDRRRRAQGARQGAEARRAPARGVRGRPRVGRRGLRRQGRARPGEDDPGDRLRGLHRPSRRAWRPGSRRRLLRPAEHDVSVRDVRGRGRGRPRHGRVEGEEGRRRRRLRHADQPDDRRGPDHGRPHRGLRAWPRWS